MRVNKMMMLRPLVFTVLLFVIVSFCGQNVSVANAAELKIGVMNVQKVLLESVSGKAAKNLFETKAKELKGKFQNDENALAAMQQ
ncbi:MAG: OmpH family outer membrane protein, partial [Desulfocapsaceae bacterium]|nr:OmpH family outer membrane protein [Desulfocapsaceae bacterium]